MILNQNVFKHVYRPQCNDYSKFSRRKLKNTEFHRKHNLGCQKLQNTENTVKIQKQAKPNKTLQQKYHPVASALVISNIVCTFYTLLTYPVPQQRICVVIVY